MTPSRPYLIRALYEWITDNGHTPYIIVAAETAGVVVPTRHIENGIITLNISQEATQNLRLGNDAVELQARFGEQIFHIYLPIPAITAIFAYETKQGMEFSELDITNYEGETGEDGSGTKSIKPHLKIIS